MGQIINNHHKIIISLHGVPPKVQGNIFEIKVLIEDKLFWEKTYVGLF